MVGNTDLSEEGASPDRERDPGAWQQILAPSAAAMHQSLLAEQSLALGELLQREIPRNAVELGDVIARQKDYEKHFIENGSIAFMPNGIIAELSRESLAVAAIQAKAKELGYGPELLNVPITPVPGGYVGRFAGHDVYA